MIKYYKASYNGKCRNLQYEEGKIYEIQGELRFCENGFHFCDEIESTLNFYKYKEDFVLIEIEPLGKILRLENIFITDRIKIPKIYSHDESRKMLEIIRWKFDENDNLIYRQDNEGNEHWYEYDKKGNCIYYKCGSCEEYWMEYDDKNREIHYKSSTGYQYWKKYDNNDNLINYKNSDKYEEYREYNENNKLIYSKDSNGFEALYEYDKYNNLIHYEDSDGHGY